MKRASALTVIVIALWPRPAGATCFPWIDPQGREMVCCGRNPPPGGCQPWRRPPPPPPPPRPAPPREDAESWDRAREGRWNLELGAGVSAGSGAAVGGDVNARLVYRWGVRGDFLSRLYAGLAMALVGNEVGPELRGGLLAFQRDQAWQPGGYAALRLGNQLAFGRWRMGAPVSFFEIGVIKIAGSPAKLHYGLRVPASVLVSRRVGIELELIAQPVPRLLGGSLRLVVRL